MSKEWVTKSIGEILQLEYGKPLPDSERIPAGKYPVYGANGEKARADVFLYDKPSIVVGRKGSAGELKLTAGKFWPLDVTYYAVFDESQFDYKFLYYVLLTLDLPKLARGVKPGINRNDVYALKVMVPPLPEQQRIVRLLDEAFEGITIAKANAERNLQNARVLFETHLHDVFATGANGWKSAPLDEICDLISRGISPSYSEAGDTIVLNQRCVRNRQVDFGQSRRHDGSVKKVAETRLLQPGDVLVNSTGVGTLGRVGQVMTLPQRRTTVDSHITILRPKADLFVQEFFGYMLIAIEASIALLGQGSGGQTELAKSALSATHVAWHASRAEQKRIVSNLDELMRGSEALASTYVKKLAALEDLRKSLLNQAFRGELEAA